MFSTEEVNNIIKLSESISQKEIARLYAVHQPTISTLLRKNGIKTKRGRLNNSRLSLDVDYFKIINTTDKAYWLGFICADGTIKKSNDKVTLASKDFEVIQNFRTAINSGHTIGKNTSIDKRTQKIYESWSIQIGNALFVANLINLGVTSKKSDVLNFPNIEEKYYPYFIAGLFDGDGSIFLRGKNKDNLGVNLISTKEVLVFIKKYMLENFKVKGIKDWQVSVNKDNVWKLYFYKDAQKFLDFIYQDSQFPYYLKRKYDKYVKYKKQTS
jgi:hypothetical protein